MALITWNETYSVRIKEFDHQHRQLIDCVNELQAAMEDGTDSVLLTSTVRKLALLAKQHFSSEEEVMERTGYPDFEIHRLIHHLLCAHLDYYGEKYERGEVILNAALLNFLRSWLDKHITGMDMGYSDFLNAKGVF